VQHEYEDLHCHVNIGSAVTVNTSVAEQGRSDAMEIKQVAEVLAAAGLDAPALDVLVPDERNYIALLMQPQGEIEAGPIGVRNRDRDLAHRQFGRFLTEARQSQADLVVTPEYSLPWKTLVAAIKEGTVPAQGKLWALGCESIKFSELEVLKQDLAPSATVLSESLQPDAARFTDPLAYVFLAAPQDPNGVARTVVLVQFKTYPMGDADHFEVNGLQRGTRIYKFGGVGQPLRLVSLICSDAFAFNDAHAEDIYDRALVVHIQLTPKPRDEQFRQYRASLLKFQGDATEIICLNWARDVRVWCGEQAKPRHTVAGSAWYLKSEQFDKQDATLCQNHRRGLYYTWLRPQYAHALFFNFDAATYLLTASKVAHIGVPGPISPRRGPQLTKTCVWHDAATAWVEQVNADDGFSAVIGESGHAKDELKRIADENPFYVERVLALCAGKIENCDDWYDVRNLDSCVINSSEVINRITFCQDTDEHARNFRVARLKHCEHLWNILKTDGPLPPALTDLKDGFRLEWSPDFPHQNAISATGQRATVIYMGEDSSAAQIEETATRVAEHLRRWFSDSNQRLLARQRLSVWFRGREGKLVLHEPYRYVKIDQTGDTSEFDIGRDT
jgi:hypothetical protein